jgi:AAA15 family ATPase/GTPase
MSKHFIKNIKITNFKCFDDFEAEGFARVNLITGKNNVGKTAFMEACFINTSSLDIKTMTHALTAIKYMRNKLNFTLLTTENKASELVAKFLEEVNNVYIETSLNLIEFKILEKDGIKEYNFICADNKGIKINVKDFSFEKKAIENIMFIDIFGYKNKQIKQFFTCIQIKDKESFLNEILKKFDNNIDGFKVIGDRQQCKINGKYLELTELGDGTRHLISIIISLFKCENGYLFIDEIDNGIHYSKLDELWEVILKTSKELNVQVFATTHSKECLESYARIAKKLKDEEVSLIELGKKDEKIESIVFNYNGLSHQVEQKLEVRGW